MLRADWPAIDVGPAVAHYAAHGWARLGAVLTAGGAAALRERADEIMLGRFPDEGFFFQLDTESGRYDDLHFGRGWEGATTRYRKVEKLERDERFAAWIANPLFERVARAVIAGPIAIYRACLMNKPAHGGTPLHWHQDGGRFWGIDRPPVLQIWTALDDAPPEAGCVEVLPGSHARGLVTPNGGAVPAEAVAAAGADAAAVAVPAKAGEAVLLHNHCWHRSGVNATGQPRRAFSICYMSAATRCLRTRRAPREFITVFG